MKLRRRKRKRSQALDAIASVAKTWSEWQLAKRAGKGVAKAKSLRPPSGGRSADRSKRIKLIGGVALAGGAGAALFRKLTRSDPEPTYTGPAPSEAYSAPATGSDGPSPSLAIAPDPVPDAGETPAAGASALRDSGDDVPATVEEPAGGDGGAADLDAEPAAGAAALQDTDDDAPSAASEEPPAEPPDAGGDAPSDEVITTADAPPHVE